MVGWLIYSHFNITAFTSGKRHPTLVTLHGQFIALIRFDHLETKVKKFR